MRLALVTCLLLTGCASPKVEVPTYGAMHHNVPRLLAHPQAGAAMQAAPEFVREVLNTVREQDRLLNQPK